jgi:hypothetical protein
VPLDDERAVHVEPDADAPIDRDPAAEHDEDEPSIEPGPAARDRLYRQHIFSAHYFAQSAQALEAGEQSETTPDVLSRYRAAVTASIFCAAAFLEASINELYVELQNLTQAGHPRLPQRELALLRRVWPGVLGSPILQKYQVALSVADADSFDETKSPFVDAEGLLRLRDALLICTPEWHDSRGRHRTLEKRLKTKFPPSPLVSKDRPWFPERCLSAGCANWAVRTAQAFSDDFCRRMGIPARARVGREGAA